MARSDYAHWNEEQDIVWWQEEGRHTEEDRFDANEDWRDEPEPEYEDEDDNEPECIERHKGNCKGKVEYRESLSGTGTPIPRCDFHWEERLELQEQHLKVYPNSPCPPSWFDPAYAGESWDED